MGNAHLPANLLLFELPRYHPKKIFLKKIGCGSQKYRGYLNYGSSALGLIAFGNYSKSSITRWTDPKLTHLGSFIPPMVPSLLITGHTRSRSVVLVCSCSGPGGSDIRRSDFLILKNKPTAGWKVEI